MFYGIFVLTSVLVLTTATSPGRPVVHECTFGKTKYKIGEQIIAADCSSRCECFPGGNVGCRNLCDRHPQGILCGLNEEAVQVPRKVPNSNCTCPSWKCSKIKGHGHSPIQFFPGGCVYGGIVHKNGEKFISSDCLGYCKCSGRGIACVSLCPPMGVRCQSNEIEVQYPRRFHNSNCTCPRPMCVKKDTCVLGDSVFPRGHFITPDCGSKCQCGPDGSVRCLPLCPFPGVTCRPGEHKVPVPRKVPNSQCTCPSWKCIKQDKCAVGGGVFKVGERFIPPDCSGYCKCHPGGGLSCVSLCPPEQVGCLGSHVNVPYQRKIYNSNCTCPSWKCVKKDTCAVGGGVFKIGENFIPPDCSGQCKCHHGGGLSCVSLCPPVQVGCLGSHVKVPYQRKIYNSNCTCPSWKCVIKKVGKPRQRRSVSNGLNAGCTVLGKTYKVGETFIPSDCRGQCMCGEQGHSCVSLCPPHGVKCAPGHVIMKTVGPRILGSNCRCPLNKCVAKGQVKKVMGKKIAYRLQNSLSRRCTVGGKTYKKGERFIPSDCRGRCICGGANRVSCVSLCPPQNIPCGPGYQLIDTVSPPMTGSNCRCPSKKCVPKDTRRKKREEAMFCSIEGKTYKPKERFTAFNCSGYCTCLGPHSGCVSLCPPHFVSPCKKGETRITVDIPVTGTECTCPSWRCVEERATNPLWLQKTEW